MQKSLLFLPALMLGIASSIASTQAQDAPTVPRGQANPAIGSGALALAALIAAHAPDIASSEKKALAAMLNGDLSFTASVKATIAIDADSVACRAGNVDIAEYDCVLKFGAASQTLKNREAHELYATLIENGVVPDGAAGSVYAAVAHLACQIAPETVKQKAGGGATCTWTPGP